MAADCRTDRRYEVVSQVVHAGETLSVPERATDPVVEPTGRPNLVRITYLQPLVDLPVSSPAEGETPPDRYIR
ncbi:hypothetical protein [Halovivax limisalsi]|uniref:hypothetical protein n=1 Tax=Halovivax limisalsi TaxID=1453760 RepID=UPI001FFD7467|nr:hypothetical protein [Halovivax limisalsi]